ncbi:hypothetical protein EDEG_02498 [Edhazardia aedis USNM 41457]|uniref:Uncharacterized protein n=1 Tax=Edhazardia aedis (strain USNM 41457) TaxID=1003232 RepID=J9DP67_EDHAE|nr:hypothetical protein EDEG_02498 [Edhazardia aedis USNM 41457]|eukprot:EJW03127.1 hypothetical protein EDEG_02498 [Edhazardia aedis USNM 41457]
MRLLYFFGLILSSSSLRKRRNKKLIVAHDFYKKNQNSESIYHEDVIINNSNCFEADHFKSNYSCEEECEKEQHKKICMFKEQNIFLESQIKPLLNYEEWEIKFLKETIIKKEYTKIFEKKNDITKINSTKNKCKQEIFRPKNPHNFEIYKKKTYPLFLIPNIFDPINCKTNLLNEIKRYKKFVDMLCNEYFVVLFNLLGNTTSEKLFYDDKINEPLEAMIYFRNIINSCFSTAHNNSNKYESLVQIYGYHYYPDIEMVFFGVFLDEKHIKNRPELYEFSIDLKTDYNDQLFPNNLYVSMRQYSHARHPELIDYYSQENAVDILFFLNKYKLDYTIFDAAKSIFFMFFIVVGILSYIYVMYNIISPF